MTFARVSWVIYTPVCGSFCWYPVKVHSVLDNGGGDSKTDGSIPIVIYSIYIFSIL